jgi:DNA gyrase subunit A
VIDTIRRSRTADTARKNLMRKFKLSELQATAILDMQLRRLAAMERNKLKEEEKELKARIQYLEALLASQAKQLGVIKEETAEIKEKYATPRRTTIVDAAPGEGSAPITAADLSVPEHAQMVVVTTAGVQRGDASGYSYKVSTGISSRAVTAHRMRLQLEPTESVFFVSSAGGIWAGPVGRVPQKASLSDMGLKRDETIVHAGRFAPEGYLVLGTAQGKIKRVAMPGLVETAAEGMWTETIGLTSGDRVTFAGVCDDKGEILFFTDSKVLRISAETVSCQQTPSARGVAGIKLRKDDVLLGGAVMPHPKNQMVFILSEKGYFKRVPIDEFSVQGRGSMGVLSLNPTKATGKVVAAAVGQPTRSTKVDVLGTDRKRQRISLRSIPIDKRANRGKKVIKVEQAAEIVILD